MCTRQTWLACFQYQRERKDKGLLTSNKYIRERFALRYKSKGSNNGCHIPNNKLLVINSEVQREMKEREKTKESEIQTQSNKCQRSG